MGIGVSAAHLVIFLALASAGTVLASTLLHTMADNTEAQTEAGHRLREAANERFTLSFEQYVNGPKRVETEWSNDGSKEVLLGDVSIFVEGVFTPSNAGSIVRFRVLEDTSSNIWMPGETLELWVDVDADVDVAIAGPHGTMAYRRA